MIGAHLSLDWSGIFCLGFVCLFLVVFIKNNRFQKKTLLFFRSEFERWFLRVVCVSLHWEYWKLCQVKTSYSILIGFSFESRLTLLSIHWNFHSIISFTQRIFLRLTLMLIDILIIFIIIIILMLSISSIPSIVISWLSGDDEPFGILLIGILLSLCMAFSLFELLYYFSIIFILGAPKSIVSFSNIISHSINPLEHLSIKSNNRLIINPNHQQKTFRCINGFTNYVYVIEDKLFIHP